MTTYREAQRQRAVQIRDALFKDPGAGIFFGKEREFVLQDPALNLWAGIREDAKDYFDRNEIPWWKGSESEPTGHLLSSQVACVNHLYAVRQRRDVASAVLQAIDPEIREALPVDDGFVEFEFVGSKPYLGERGFTRGANCTSIDAVMMGAHSDHSRVLFLIEWKYTESYRPENLYIPARAQVYDSLITDPDGPFISGIDPQHFYYEPFYQMMRQTLLASQFEKHAELECRQCVNVHVIPEQNRELKTQITSPGLPGQDIHDAWLRVLKEAEKYVPIDPTSLLKPALDLPDTLSWRDYLQARYW